MSRIYVSTCYTSIIVRLTMFFWTRLWVFRKLILYWSYLIFCWIWKTTHKSIVLIYSLIYLKTILYWWSSVRFLHILILSLNLKLFLIVGIIPRLPQILQFPLLPACIRIHSSRTICILSSISSLLTLLMLIPVFFRVSHCIKISIGLKTLLIIHAEILRGNNLGTSFIMSTSSKLLTLQHPLSA